MPEEDTQNLVTLMGKVFDLNKIKHQKILVAMREREEQGFVFSYGDHSESSTGRKYSEHSEHSEYEDTIYYDHSEHSDNHADSHTDESKGTHSDYSNCYACSYDAEGHSDHNDNHTDKGYAEHTDQNIRKKKKE